MQYTSVAFFEGRATILSLAKTWTISYICNLGGILFFLFVNCIWAGVFASQSQQDYCREYAVGKAQEPTWYNILLSAIGGEQLPSSPLDLRRYLSEHSLIYVSQQIGLSVLPYTKVPWLATSSRKSLLFGGRFSFL